MSEWKDFLEGLPDETALTIELVMALEQVVAAIENVTTSIGKERNQK